jgi:hypothetical protein
VGVRKIFLEIEDIFDVRASEGVDAVVREEPTRDEVVRVLDVEVVDGRSSGISSTLFTTS